MEVNPNIDISFPIEPELKKHFIKETLSLPCNNFHCLERIKNQHIEFTELLITRFIKFGKVDKVTFICGIILMKRFSKLQLPKTQHSCFDLASTILLIAHKWMNDEFYRNSTWKKLTYIENKLKKINKEERFIHSSLQYKVAVFPDEINGIFYSIYNKPQSIAENLYATDPA